MSDESDYYIVRGAKMKCDKGTHPRKINLLNGHGAYANEKPLMNGNDKVVNENIPYFGICTGDCPSSGEDIYLVTEDGKNVNGKKCMVAITEDGEWMKVKEDMIIKDAPALTMDSTIVCKFGGQISFISNGQEES